MFMRSKSFAAIVHLYCLFIISSSFLVVSVLCRLLVKQERASETVDFVKTNANLPVAKQFSFSGSSVNDMIVSVICAGFRSTQDRRRI